MWWFIKHVWKTVIFGSALLGLYYLPADLEGLSAASGPWKKFFAMVSSDGVVWLAAGAVFFWLAWTELRQMIKDRRTLARQPDQTMWGMKMVDEKPSNINQSININSMSGGSVSPVYHNFHTIVAPGRVELSDEGVSELVEALRGRTVSIDIVGDQKSFAIGYRLVDRLVGLGVTALRPTTCSLMPGVNDPYTLHLSQDGKTAHLVISPATLP
jgi:heme exporter protein D